jgi:hypothetical protein
MAEIDIIENEIKFTKKTVRNAFSFLSLAKNFFEIKVITQETNALIIMIIAPFKLIFPSLGFFSILCISKFSTLQIHINTTPLFSYNIIKLN